MSAEDLISEDLIEFLDLENRVSLCEINTQTLRKLSKAIPSRREHAQTVVKMHAVPSAKILLEFLIGDYLEAHHGYLEMEDNSFMNTIWTEIVARIIRTVMYIHQNFDDNQIEFETIILDYFKKTPDLFFDLISSLDLKTAPVFLVVAEDRLNDPEHRLVRHFFDKYEKIEKTRSMR